MGLHLEFGQTWLCPLMLVYLVTAPQSRHGPRQSRLVRPPSRSILAKPTSACFSVMYHLKSRPVGDLIRHEPVETLTTLYPRYPSMIVSPFICTYIK